MAIMNRTTAPHYRWGDACDGWRHLDTSDLSVIEERMHPRTAERRHTHGRAKQVFFVLSGTLTIDADGIVAQLNPSDSLNILPGTPHQVRNDSTSEDARFLVISAPSTRGDRTPA